MAGSSVKDQKQRFSPEVESSRTHFEVLGLGLEARSPWKFFCPRLEDSTISWTVKILLKNARNLAENLRRPFFVFLTWRSPEKKFLRPFFWDRLKEFFEDLFFLFRRTLASVSLVLGLGLERFCSWPWPRNFFVSLALASSLMSSTPPLVFTANPASFCQHVHQVTTTGDWVLKQLLECVWTWSSRVRFTPPLAGS